MHTLRKEPTMAPSSAVKIMIRLGGKMGLTEVKKLPPNGMVNSSLDRIWQNLYHSPMKLTSLVVFGTCIALSHASAKIDVTAEIVTAHEKKDPAEGGADAKKPTAPAAPGAAPKPINQEKAIAITLRNASAKPEAGVLVRYWFIGRDMKTMKNTLLDGGESTADLKPSSSTVINSEPTKSSYTQKQIFVQAAAKPGMGGGAKGGQPAAPPAKPAEAGGTKISGYAVQVISKEGKVVAETFLESGYKQLVGSDGNKPGPLFKKPEAEPAAQ